MAEDTTKQVTDEARKKLTGLEGWLDSIFGAKFPVQLPKAAREWIVKVSPWLALVGGVVSLWAAWAFWQAGHYVNQLANWANSLSAAYGVPTTSTRLGVMWYLALVVLVVQAVFMLLAFSGLRDRKKRGWNLLFYSSLVALALGVVELFVSGYGFGSLIGSLIGTAIGMFILFQIRSYYKA
jgi:hypothetical protein